MVMMRDLERGGSLVSDWRTQDSMVARLVDMGAGRHHTSGIGRLGG